MLTRLLRRFRQAYLRALVKDGTVASEDDLIHEHGAEGPFVHPKLALHMAQWCNPSFASVVNGWVLRYIAADRTLAEDITHRAEGGGGMATLGSSLTHTMQEVPVLPESQPQGEAEAEAEAPLPEATASAAAAEVPAAKAPPLRKAPPADEEEGAPMVEEKESEPSEEEAGPTPVKTPKTRQTRRARIGAKSTPRAKATPGRVAKAAGRRRRRAATQESYKVNLHRVLKQVHPDMSISAKGMEVLNVRLHGLLYSSICVLARHCLPPVVLMRQAMRTFGPCRTWFATCSSRWPPRRRRCCARTRAAR